MIRVELERVLKARPGPAGGSGQLALSSTRPGVTGDGQAWGLKLSPSAMTHRDCDSPAEPQRMLRLTMRQARLGFTLTVRMMVRKNNQHTTITVADSRVAGPGGRFRQARVGPPRC